MLLPAALKGIHRQRCRLAPRTMYAKPRAPVQRCARFAMNAGRRRCVTMKAVGEHVGQVKSMYANNIGVLTDQSLTSTYAR
jgi:hypothetical protein